MISILFEGTQMASMSPQELDCRDWAFEIPPELEAGEPPEARGLARDEVRLMVSYVQNRHIEHGQFRALPEYLRARDVLVINTSGTLNAALDAVRLDNGTPYELHLSTRLADNRWVVEMRTLDGEKTVPVTGLEAGLDFALPGGGTASLLTAYHPEERAHSGPTRLWIASVELPLGALTYLERYGFPIRYGYVEKRWSSSYYQTVYATELGSAEMPSAGRPFTESLLSALNLMGVHIVPLVLHTGISSVEAHERPYDEFYRVSELTAQAVTAARAEGRRVIAVGTTVVRALETVTGSDGITRAGEGWTGLVITPERGIRAVDGLLTGLHESGASHLAMLTAISSCEHLERAYSEAIKYRYLWHEFGDMHLILP